MPRHKKVASLLALFVGFAWFAWSGPAQAGVNVWTTTGPEGGEISDLVADPQTPGVMWLSKASFSFP